MRKLKRQVGCIYCIKNNLSGKMYIGQTNDVVRRFKEYNRSERYSRLVRPIEFAIKKYGIDNFSFSVLKYCNSQKRLDRLEQACIRKRNTLVPNGYNIESGGRAKNKKIIILSLEEEGIIIEAYEKSKCRSLREASDITGYNTNIVKRTLQRHGISITNRFDVQRRGKTNAHPAIFSLEQEKEMIRLYREEYVSARDIARQFQRRDEKIVS